jgi:hypothetical protein
MSRFRIAAGIAATTAVLIAAPTVASADDGSQASPRVFGACAELTENGPGWALLRNDCAIAIEGSVDLSSGDRPTCVPIAPHGTNTVIWKGGGRAEYAVDCV